MADDDGKTLRENLHLIRRIRFRVALVVFGFLAFFLFSSEYVNSVFNVRLDQAGATAVERLAFAFKPTVIALFFLFSAILYTVIMRYLRPLLRYLATGEDHRKARSAAINIPWVIIVFQLVAWTVGTSVFYLIHGWYGTSGIPYPMGLLLKVAVGLPAAVFTSILFNIILIPAKQTLRINEMHPDENDRFSRYRDFYAIGAVVVFITVNYSYIVSYYAQAREVVSFSELYLPLILLSLFYAAVSFGLIVLSKWEYFLQIRSIDSALVEMASGRTNVERRIEITNFNELGAISAHVNTILDTFLDLLRKISVTAERLSESSQRLSSASQENAAYSNQQASSTAEIVSTMEDVNRLSEEIGRQVHHVEESATNVKERVQEGFRITKENIEKMKEVTESYSETIGGMKNLGEHIAGIWEIVKIINGIAGQIKIIAFNAALEASSAGEAGKNFEIVAGEIRRLADSTVASTNEIRSRIGDIQHASDDLISSSEADTLKIQDAARMSDTLETVFETILESSEATSSAAGEMTLGVEQQINAFEQVLVTSRQISEAIHEFAGTIEESSATAEALEETVDTLNEIVERSRETEER
jgi:methyl-accepting chemotaxis protein